MCARIYVPQHLSHESLDRHLKSLRPLRILMRLNPAHAVLKLVDNGVWLQSHTFCDLFLSQTQEFAPSFKQRATLAT
jgi:hypothetical protein